MEPSPRSLRQFIGALYQPWIIDGDDFGAISGMNAWQGKQKYSEETYPSAALFNTDPSGLTRARSRARAVGSRRPIALGTTRHGLRMFHT
jgi:hypothetical protein